MSAAYLDSSAIVKRYVLGPGSDTIGNVYKALNGELALSFSIQVKFSGRSISTTGGGG